MKLVRKKEGKIIQAWCLGEGSEMQKNLEEKGWIRQVDETHWRLLSQEASEGELATAGDYFKVDSTGHPYPNTREFFVSNHKALGEDRYEQIPQPCKAWDVQEPMCPEIRFLMEKKGLEIHEDQEKAYFCAPLWGDILKAAKDAVIVFYSIVYGENAYGEDRKILDADFNFVAREEFEKIYEVLKE